MDGKCELWVSELGSHHARVCTDGRLCGPTPHPTYLIGTWCYAKAKALVTFSYARSIGLLSPVLVATEISFTSTAGSERETPDSRFGGVEVAGEQAVLVARPSW